MEMHTIDLHTYAHVCTLYVLLLSDVNFSSSFASCGRFANILELLLLHHALLKCLCELLACLPSRTARLWLRHTRGDAVLELIKCADRQMDGFWWEEQARGALRRRERAQYLCKASCLHKLHVDTGKERDVLSSTGTKKAWDCNPRASSNSSWRDGRRRREGGGRGGELVNVTHTPISLLIEAILQRVVERCAARLSYPSVKRIFVVVNICTPLGKKRKREKFNSINVLSSWVTAAARKRVVELWGFSGEIALHWVQHESARRQDKVLLTYFYVMAAHLIPE